MQSWTGDLFELFLVHWQSATLTDYGNILLAVVLVGWALTRQRG